jgi:hypothetical protein
MFDFLTHCDWCDAGCGNASWGGLPETCRKLRFLRAGSLRWWAFSDYLEADERDDWNFDLASDSSGRVRLTSGSLIRFERRGDVLVFADGVYRPCARPPAVADSSQLGRRSLRPVPIPELLVALCRHAWTVEDDLDLDHDDRTLRFSSSLECELGSRLGGRARRASYSLVHQTSRLQLGQSTTFARVQIGPDVTSNYTLALTGDTLLVNGRRYVGERAPGSEHRARGLGSRVSLPLDLAYDGELEAGRPTQLRLEFKSPERLPSARAPSLTRLRIGAHPRTRDDRGVLRKHITPVASRTYAGRELGPGTTLADTVTFVPPFSGEFVALVLEWTFRDGDGEHRLVATPVVRIR